MSKFPIGGKRSPVFAALECRGFVMSNWSDKWWSRSDGVEACIYGTGSRLALKGAVVDDGPIDEVLARLPQTGKAVPHA